MSSAGDPNRPSGEGSHNDAPTNNRPWPFPSVDPFTQGRFERKFLADGATINFDRVPMLPSWARFFRMDNSLVFLSVASKVSIHSTIAQRPLTEVEATAISEHAGRAVRKFVWSQPVTWGIVAAFTYAGRRTFKFPFYQPKIKHFDPYRFPSRRIPLVRGYAAWASWHVIRMFAYLPLVWITTVIFFRSVEENSFEAHIMRDARLAPLVREIRQRSAEHRRLRVGAPNPTGTDSTQRTQQTGGGAYQRSQTPQEYGGSNRAPHPNTTFEKPSSTAESPQTAYPSWPGNTSTQPASYGMPENTPPVPSRRREDHDSNLFDDDNDDDASPVASSSRRREVQSSSSGSSWDRIRQQARSGNPNWEKGDSSGQEEGWAQLRQDKSRNPKDSNPKTDSYSYSNDDEERERRNYEKEQAQKEFDALLEAERRGDERSSGGRGGRR